MLKEQDEKIAAHEATIEKSKKEIADLKQKLIY